MVKEMDKERRFGKMVISIKVIGTKIKLKAMV